MRKFFFHRRLFFLGAVTMGMSRTLPFVAIAFLSWPYFVRAELEVTEDAFLSDTALEPKETADVVGDRPICRQLLDTDPPKTQGSEAFLTFEEERELIALFQKGSEKEKRDAINKIQRSFSNYIKRLARKMAGRSYSRLSEDLLQAGAVGLVRAVKKFDLELPSGRLVSFATPVIQREMFEVMIGEDPFKFWTTKTVRILFSKYTTVTDTSLSPDEVAELVNEEAGKIKVTARDVVLVRQYLSDRPISFDGPADFGDPDGKTIGDFVAAPGRPTEDFLHASETKPRALLALALAIAKLSEREKTIIEKRLLVDEHEEWTLHRLAERFGVSAERVRQVEKLIYKKLKSEMQELIPGLFNGDIELADFLGVDFGE